MTTAIIFDTETTGRIEPQAIEAAYLGYDIPAEIGFSSNLEFYSRFKPNKPIELGALATHHILDEELTRCPDSSSFSLPEGTQYIIGHKVDYDWEVIGKPDVKRICTLALARDLWPDLDSHTQSALIYHFFRKGAKELIKDAHNALADVKLCRMIFQMIMDELGFGESTTWEEIWLRSERARIPKKIMFGKHAGMAIAELPGDYCSWLISKADQFDPYLIATVKNRMAPKVA